ncbi:MAG: cation:proton antiporter [Gammaproteobacteria bacterium]|nr:cation:proton antiporter [Gammaproteobacteria bacterium]
MLVLAHILGYAFKKLKLPRVIGEISGGLLLGPTVLGSFSPELYTWLFNAFEFEGKLIAMISWFGLVLLMFVAGFEIQASLDRDDKKTIVALLFGSTLPFFAGWIAPVFYDFSPYLGEKQNMLALTIVIGIAVAVTSIPVIAKIFVDLNIMNTRFAKIVLATATIHDVLLWVALAIATGLASAEHVSTSTIASHITVSFAFIGVAVTLMPKAMSFLHGLRYNLLLKSSSSGYVLSVCFLFSGVASILGVNVVFGAFLAGVVLGIMPNATFAEEKAHIKEIAMAFFVPLYFAVVGLRLDLIHHFDMQFFLFFLLFTSAFGMVGTLIAARMIKKDWLSSVNFAVAMITRGGPGIVLATIAFDFGIINETFFVTLVLIAILTSLLAGVWFRFLLSNNYELLKT